VAGARLAATPARRRAAGLWPATRLARAPVARAARRLRAALRHGGRTRLAAFALAALNADLERASARLAGAALSASRWGGATLLAPPRGLARGLVEPALRAWRGAARRRASSAG